MTAPAPDPAPPRATAPAHPRRGVVAAAVLLVVVVIGTGAVQLFSQIVSGTIESTSVLTPLADRFTVDTDADLTVVPSTDGQVRVHTVVRHGLGQPDLVEESTPAGVRLDVRCNAMLTSRCDVAYTVELPPSFEVVVSGMTGDVTARGLTGPVRIDRGSGDIALFDVNGPVDVTSITGEITAMGLGSDTVRAESITGDVRLELLQPPQSVQVDATSGEVDVIVPAGAGYRVSAWTRSGERAVTVPVDPSSPRMITVDGGSGDVRLHTG